jgi:beta-lactam-binding protein with PASTA domain
MPDVRGLPQAAARDTLEIFGLTVGEVTELVVADSVEAGGGRPVVVTGQEPGPRRPVPTGSAIRLELGFAPEEARRLTAQGAARPSAPAAVPEDVTAGETPENEAARGQPGPADPGPPPDEEPAPDPVSPDDEEF